MPVPSATITFASKWVDEALGFAMGWNYFLNIILNIIDVSWFGAAEFYIGIFKVLLAVGLTFYTFITMVGGNPQHDVYGFRYWNQPGAFAEYLVDGPGGRLCGVVAAMVQAGFTFCGPEYLGMIAAETRNPRRVIHRAYKTFLIRVLLFFIGGALCIGIVIPYNDSTLARLLDEGVSTGAASPYVISMQRLGIAGLGSVINAGIMVSLVSAGNALLFSAARTLYGMALDGKAPRVLGVCTKKGIPIWALFVSLSFCLLGLLQVSESSAKVMNYLVILITANQLLNHFSVSLTYIHFYRALHAQNIDRNTLPYKGRFQPYTSYVAVTSTALLTLLLGFDLFVDVPNNWSIRYFCLNYAMLAFYVVMFVGWKVFRKTRYVKASEVDLGLGGAREEIETAAMATLIKPLILAPVVLTCYIIAKIYLTLIHTPLARIPGPKLFALTKWGLAYEDYRGTRTRYMHTLHTKYGNAVRIGPNEVSFNSLSALRNIYGAGTKLLNHAYSKTSILSPRNRDMVETKARQFIDLIEREADKSGTFEIFGALHYFSLDTITAFLYGGNPLGPTTALTAKRDRALLDDILDHDRRKLSWFTVHFPKLTEWLYTRTGVLESVLTYLDLLPMRKPSTYSGIRTHALAAAEMIHESSISGSKTLDTSACIAERLLSATRTETAKGAPPMDHIDVAAECSDHLLAGIDTTSDTTMWVLFALSQPDNHIYQEKLRAEVQSLELDVEDGDGKVVNGLTADKLPYLDAVIKETLRLFAPLPGTEPRFADSDQVINGYIIPRGTVVSMSPYTLHRNPAVFKDPLRFNPERWIDSPAEEIAEMKRWFWAFASGGRMCIGMQ
ncbi:amino acid permease-domain-containing protein [Aspergillus germanicus]